VADPATRLGVIGWPVAHSLSPVFQNAGLRAAGLPAWRYQRLPIPEAAFAETVAALPGAGFRGVNVTLPHKQRALALAGQASSRAGAIGAANTLLFAADGQVWADNTDAPGLIEVLPGPPAGRTALVLGAGGVARAAVWALLDAGAARVQIWNRTPERARRLADELGADAVTRAEPADLLVHCTSVGLGDETTLDGLPLGATDLASFGTVVDFVYRPGSTALIRAARQARLPAVDGRELLLAQGALSFELFTGRPAPVAEMRAARPRS
jgi:shikimate dehydrogenase